MKDDIELKYCDVCMQMTNHEHLINPLMNCWDCLKCRKKRNKK